MSKKRAQTSSEEKLDTWATRQKKEEVPHDVRLLLRENDLLKKKLLQGQGAEDAIIQAVKEVYSRPSQLILPPPPKQKSARGKLPEEIASNGVL